MHESMSVCVSVWVCVPTHKRGGIAGITVRVNEEPRGTHSLG